MTTAADNLDEELLRFADGDMIADPLSAASEATASKETAGALDESSTPPPKRKRTSTTSVRRATDELEHELALAADDEATMAMRFREQVRMAAAAKEQEERQREEAHHFKDKVADGDGDESEGEGEGEGEDAYGRERARGDERKNPGIVAMPAEEFESDEGGSRAGSPMSTAGSGSQDQDVEAVRAAVVDPRRLEVLSSRLFWKRWAKGLLVRASTGVDREHGQRFELFKIEGACASAAYHEATLRPRVADAEASTFMQQVARGETKVNLAGAKNRLAEEHILALEEHEARAASVQPVTNRANRAATIADLQRRAEETDDAELVTAYRERIAALREREDAAPRTAPRGQTMQGLAIATIEADGSTKIVHTKGARGYQEVREAAAARRAEATEAPAGDAAAEKDAAEKTKQEMIKAIMEL
ncbi:hypothetical protein JCM3770_002598 [Rhodotorula araucariae]